MSKRLNLAAASRSGIHHHDIYCRTTVPVREVSLLPTAMPGTTATPMNNLALKDDPPTQLTWDETSGRFGLTTLLPWAQQRELEALEGGARSNAWPWTHLSNQNLPPPSCSGPHPSPKPVLAAGCIDWVPARAGVPWSYVEVA